MSDAVSSGEEYELAVTASAPIDVAAFEACFSFPLTEIGRVEPPEGTAEVVLAENGVRVDLPRGHDHFSR